MNSDLSYQAPQFDGIEGFDKSQNGLFKIRTCTNRGGFIHINLDASHFNHAPDCEKLVDFSAGYGLSPSSKWLTGWESGGGFNWKTVGKRGNFQALSCLDADHDGFQERVTAPASVRLSP